ncbi:hypothetical protein [Sphingomonas pokkalii]|nr:hypothetical protein [Sphingomonas pokkalii]
MAEQDEPAHIATDRARGGTTPGVTRYVLLFGMLLVIVIFAVILLV